MNLIHPVQKAAAPFGSLKVKFLGLLVCLAFLTLPQIQETF